MSCRYPFCPIRTVHSQTRSNRVNAECERPFNSKSPLTSCYLYGKLPSHLIRKGAGEKSAPFSRFGSKFSNHHASNLFNPNPFRTPVFRRFATQSKQTSCSLFQKHRGYGGKRPKTEQKSSAPKPTGQNSPLAECERQLGIVEGLKELPTDGQAPPDPAEAAVAERTWNRPKERFAEVARPES